MRDEHQQPPKLQRLKSLVRDWRDELKTNSHGLRFIARSQLDIAEANLRKYQGACRE